VHLVSASTTRIILGALVLWIGLWPAADAVTGASRVTVVLADAVPVSGCCGSCRPEPAPEEPSGGCPNSTEAASPCSGAKTSRCGQCFNLGGMVLFAVCCDGLDPELQCLGTTTAHHVEGASRHLQPPVPPPWALS